MVSTNRPQAKPTSTSKPSTSEALFPKPKTGIVKTPDILRDVLVDPNEQFRRAIEFRKDTQLQLPTDAREPTVVRNVPLPAEGTVDPAQDFVRRAASTLGFSPEVVQEAVAEMAKRDGNQLVVDKDTQKPLTTVAEFKAADNDGDGTDDYTVDASQLAVLRDVNDARGMGFQNLAELYAYQTKQFGDLMNAGLAGTDVDMDKMLKGVNDPNVRDAMIRSYEAMRGLDDLAHGQPGSIEQLGALKDMLAESAALLPKGHPLGALVLDAQKRITTAEQQLLSGAKGPYSRESMAALNNMANMTLGKLPDEAMMGGVAENLAEQAKSQGATDTQASALRDAIDIAYTIRSGNVTSTEGLSRANANLQTALDAAGKFAPKELRALLNQAATQGTVGKTMSQADPNKSEDQKAADVVSALSSQLKDAASASGNTAAAEALDALKNMADAASKGKGWDFAQAGVTSAVAIAKATAEILQKLPHLAPQAAQLLKVLGTAVKLPADVVGAVNNGYKVITGKNFDGEEISTNDRVKAGLELGLENAPSIITGVGTLAGVEVLSTLAPPIAIIYGEAKLMMMVIEEVGKAKQAMYEGELRDRFDIKNDESLDSGLKRMVEKITSGDVSRFNNASRTAEQLLNYGFTDSDTRGRFLAYASQRLGRANVDALMSGKPIPGPYSDVGMNAPDPARAVKTVELAKDLQKIVGEFLNRERSEIVNQLSNRAGAQKGGYLDPRERANRFRK